jgi:hypothetical protein
MPDYIGHKPSGFENVLFVIMIIAVVGGLGLLMLQPIYRGDEMVAELKSDCAKRGGVMLEHKKMFGTSYECASRLDR